MPKVGGKEFGYDKAGKRQAAAYAKKTGKPMVSHAPAKKAPNLMMMIGLKPKKGK